MTEPATPGPFGGQLRYWRTLRGFSQLGLALEAGTTPRHLSFLETGRSRPGSDMVLRLADVLNIPRRERNRLLVAAGLPAAFAEDELTATDLAPFRLALDRMLAAHAPFPGFVFDRRWNIMAATPAGERLLSAGQERNMIRLLLAPDGGWRDLLDNRDEVAAYGLTQLQDDALRFPHDEVLAELVELARTATSSDRDLRAAVDTAATSPSAHPRLRIADTLVETISVIARFTTPHAALLEELRIELLHPADAHADAVLRRLSRDAEAAEG